MTQNFMKHRPKIALFEPDIPQNTAAIIRTCACLGAKLEIIEPCGFKLNDKRFKRVVMDYMNEKEIKFYPSSEDFFNYKKNDRIILITTKSGTTGAGTRAQKNEVTVNTSYFTNELAMKPDFQMQYGNGFNQNFGWFFSNWGPSFDEG